MLVLMYCTFHLRCTSTLPCFNRLWIYPMRWSIGIVIFTFIQIGDQFCCYIFKTKSLKFSRFDFKVYLNFIRCTGLKILLSCHKHCLKVCCKTNERKGDCWSHRQRRWQSRIRLHHSCLLFKYIFHLALHTQWDIQAGDRKTTHTHTHHQQRWHHQQLIFVLHFGTYCLVKIAKSPTASKIAVFL